MGTIISKTIKDAVEEINRTYFLPAIQREFVWDTKRIEKLFDSIMENYPVGAFLFWKLREEDISNWIAYNFIKDYDKNNPHNILANLTATNRDVYYILDGQQRLTAFYIGLLGSYKYTYYKERLTRLYLNIIKEPKTTDDAESLKYEFSFRENAVAADPDKEYWYEVGKILKFDRISDAQSDALNLIRDSNPSITKEKLDVASTLISDLLQSINMNKFINYYEEKITSRDDYDRIIQIFVRTNTGGVKLEYSDILLSTATGNWKTMNAREEINKFTDEINKIGAGYNFEKDFVMKGCLYLTENLPVQYKIRNFNSINLLKIENNWPRIKDLIRSAVKLISKYGISRNNLVAPISLLPIALFLKSKKNPALYVESSVASDLSEHNEIFKWLVLSLLKNLFGSSTDTVLSAVREIINQNPQHFPATEIFKRLNTPYSLDGELIEFMIKQNYRTKYSFLILSLLYPSRDWKAEKFNEDHIFPKSSFTEAKLRGYGITADKIPVYLSKFNTIVNLELLTDLENKSKNATPFEEWFKDRDDNFRKRHFIPKMENYSITNFEEFVKNREQLLVEALKII